MKLFPCYLILINIIGFLCMAFDKRKARLGKSRISERMLFFIVILGGSAGSLIGMYLFRHKTKKWYFKFGIPAILILQTVLFILSINVLL